MSRLAVGVLSLAVATAVALSAESEAVSFKTDDGVEIAADYFAPTGRTPAPVVILLHQYRSTRAAWKPLVPVLQRAGFAVLAVDLRGHGGSVKPGNLKLVQRVMDRDPALFNAMNSDVFAAYGFLSQRPECDLSRLAIVGASVGASVALDYARQDRSVDVVVCMSPGEAYMGVDSRTHIREYGKWGKRPVLLLAAPGEQQACEALAAAYPGAKVQITQPGTKDGDKVHGTNMFGQVENIEQGVADFLAEHVGGPAGQAVAGDLDGGPCCPVGSEADKKLDPKSRRVFSSGEEARSRGYRASK